MTVESVRTRVSTAEVLITLSIPIERSAEAATFLSKVGQQVACAFHDPETDVSQKTKSYGDLASKLKLSGFFMMPAVWKAIGADADYLAWLRTQHCVACGDYPVEAAHVRRIADGAGTGIKPKYSAIPLCHKHHALQHQSGENALGGKDKLDLWRITMVSEWAWATLRTILGYRSFAEIEPNTLRHWATNYGLQDLLPSEYRSQS